LHFAGNKDREKPYGMECSAIGRTGLGGATVALHRKGTCGARSSRGERPDSRQSRSKEVRERKIEALKGRAGRYIPELVVRQCGGRKRGWLRNSGGEESAHEGGERKGGDWDFSLAGGHKVNVAMPKKKSRKRIRAAARARRGFIKKISEKYRLVPMRHEENPVGRNYKGRKSCGSETGRGGGMGS